MSTRKKILHIIPTFSTGGAEMLVWQYARLLDKDKYDLYVVCGVEDGALRQRFEALNAVVFVASRARHGGRFGAWKELRGFMDRIKPDLIHSHLLSSDFFAYAYKHNEKSARWVATLHNTEYHTSYPRRVLWRQILKSSDKIIAVSRSVAEFARAELSVPKKKLITILNGVDIDKWSNVPLSDLSEGREFRIATVGRLEEQKGHAYLFEALTKIKDIPWRLHVYGDGSLRHWLQKFAEEHNIADRIRWHGVVVDTPRAYAETDLLVQPSLWEGMSLVVMEAMSAGRFVIATRPAGEELIEHGVTGRLVPIMDSNRLAEEIMHAYHQKDNMRSIAARAREYAVKNFDIRKNVAEVERVYDELFGTY